MCLAAPPGLRLAPFRRVENQLLRCASYDAAGGWGLTEAPVSRLFSLGVYRCADSVLIAAGDGNTFEADLERRVSRGSKVAATQPRRRGGDSRRTSGFGGRRVAERADTVRSRKARASIRRGEFGLCDPR